MRHYLSSLVISIFQQKLIIFVISGNKEKNRISMHKLWFFNLLLSFLKVLLINMNVSSMISSKLATPGVLKIKIFWNEGYEVIISVQDVTNKIYQGLKLYCRQLDKTRVSYNILLLLSVSYCLNFFILDIRGGRLRQSFLQYS